MPPRVRKSPAPLTGARRTPEPDALDPVVETPPPPVKAASRTASRTAAKSAASKAAPVVEESQDEPQQTSRKVQRTVNLEVSILEDARAAVTYLAAYVPEAGVKSLADLVNPSLAQAVRRLEETYNKGEPFRRVGRMQAGRPTSR